MPGLLPDPVVSTMERRFEGLDFLMKRRFRIVCCILIVATRAWAGPYEDGVAACDQGRFRGSDPPNGHGNVLQLDRMTLESEGVDVFGPKADR
jgi:hypothetical protein